MSITTELAQRAESRVGSVLNGKWTLERVLGVGGMATVYGAVHRNKKRVAIKMLHSEVSTSLEVRTRFLREGYVANTVDHPGACNVIDDDVTPDGAAFLVMELLEGETLEARRERKGGRLPPAEVLSITGQLLDTLAAAHAKGIVHRDLKPENLFLMQEGRLKVLDFGIARLRETSAAATGATQAGSLLGTPAFMAPEQARGRSEQVDERTDLWAVGATMFTLLTGRQVHEAETLNEQLILAATQSAPPLRKVVDVHEAVAEVVDRALAFEKADRWKDARSMHSAIRSALEQALPDAPVSLLIGPSQRKIADDAATVAAPSGEITGPVLSGMVRARTTDAPPLTGSIALRHEARAQWLKLGAIGAAALLLGVIAAVFAMRKPHTSAEHDDARTAVQPSHEQVTPRADDHPPVREPVEAQGTAPPATSASSDPPATTKSTRPTGPTTTAAPPPSAAKTVKDPPPKPPTTAPTTTPTSANPFDKRF
jgi:serine/threonine-protein kinase